MSTLQQVLDRITLMATGIVGDSNMSPLVDSDVSAAIIWPHAIRSAVFTAIRKGDDLQDLMQSHTITFVDGIGPLPATMLREALDRAIFEDRPYVTQYSFAEFQRMTFPAGTLNLYPARGGNYYALLGSNIYFRDANTLDAEFDGDVTVFAPTLDAFPSDPDADMGLPVRMVETAIMLGVSVMRGESPLASLTGVYERVFHQPKSFEMEMWND